MATYNYKQAFLSSASGGWIKFNVEPDFGATIAPGDTITIVGQAYSKSYAVKRLAVHFNTINPTKITGGYDTGTALATQEFSVNFPRGKTTSFSLTLVVPELSGTDYNIVPWMIFDAFGASVSNIMTATAGSQTYNWVRYRIGPRIQRFSVQRCDADGTNNNEGSKLKITGLQGIVLNGTASDVTTCAVVISGGDLVSPVTVSVPVASMLAGISESAPGILASYTFSPTQAYTLTANFAAGTESAPPFVVEVSYAFANLHLAGCKTGGAAFGMFSTATENNPKLESNYPLYAYGGIANIVGGRTEQITVGGNAYFDYGINLPVTFKAAPLVVVCLESDSTAGNIGRIMAAVLADTVTASSFVIRVFNGDSTVRKPYIRWMAYGIL